MATGSLTIMLSRWWFRAALFSLATLIVWSAVGQLTGFDASISAFPALVLCSAGIEALRRDGRWFTFGMRFDLWTARDTALGFVFAGSSMLIVVLLALSTGGNYFPAESLPSPGWLSLITLVIFIYAAVEELLFRGILFQAAIQRFGKLATTLVFSLVFALLHFANREFDAILLLNLFLGSVVLSSMYISTNSLWLPVSFHFLWNWAQAAVLGLGVTGYVYDIKLMQLNNAAPAWLFGGNYGIESGVAATILLIAMIPLIFKLASVSPYMASVLFRRNYEESSH